MLKLIQLEKRIVLDAAGAATAAENLDTTPTDPLIPPHLIIPPEEGADPKAPSGEAPSSEPTPAEGILPASDVVDEPVPIVEDPADDIIFEADEQTTSGEQEGGPEDGSDPLAAPDAEQPEEELALKTEVSPERDAEIAFVDSNVKDLETLVEALDPVIEVVVIDAASDGVEQISAVLEEKSDVSAVHILSHGSPGTVNLGSTRLTSGTISEHSEELENWSDALAADADILLYGCKVDEGGIGEELLTTLSGLTGADVAASTDDSGANVLGGDWDLESQVGEIGVEELVVPEGAYTELLAEQTIDFSDSPGGFGSNAWTKDGFRFTVRNTAGGYSQANMVNRTDWAGVEIHLDPAVDPGMLIRESWPNANLELRIQRVDGQDFTFSSIWVGSNNNFNTTVRGYLSGGGVATQVVTPGEAAARYVTLGAGGSAVNVSYVTITGRTEGDWSTGFAVDTFVYDLPNQPPVVSSFENGQVTFTQAGSPVNLDVGGDATIADSDSTDFNGGNVTVRITSNEWASQDALQVGNIGSISVSGSTVSHAGTGIGTITSNGSGGNDLVVTLNSSATVARVQDLVRALQYDNTDNTSLDLGDRTIQLSVNDGDGSPAKDYSMTVNMETTALPVGTQTLTSFGISGTPTSFTDGGYTFSVSGGISPYLQTWSNDPHGSGFHISDNSPQNLTATIARSDNSDFTMHSMIVSNYDNAAISIRGYNNGSQVTTYSLPGYGTQRILFNSAVIDQIRITGQTGGTSAGMAFVDDFSYQVSNVAPVVNNLDGNTVSFTEGGSPVVLDHGNNAIVTDSDSSDFNQGQVTASITVNEWSNQDQLSVGDIGSLSVSGTTVSHSGTAIGTITSDGLSGRDLTIDLNANSTPATVQELVRALQYSNSDTSDPDLSTRTVRVTVSDGDLSPPSSNDISVKVAPPSSAGLVVEDFSGIPSNVSTFTKGDYTVTVTGGTSPRFQSSSDGPLSPAARIQTTVPGQNVTVTIVRTDGADFEANSIIAGNPDNNANVVVAGRNNGATVTSRTLSPGLMRQVDFGGAVLDEIRITGQTDPSWSVATYFDQLVTLVPNNPPTIDLDNATAGADFSTTFDEGVHQGNGIGDGVAVVNNPVISDVEGDSITQLVVTLTNPQGDVGERVFLSGSYSDVSYSLDSSNQITITNDGTATAVQMAAVLANVRYQNDDDAPTNATNRAISISVSDVRGSTTSTTTVDITLANDQVVAVDDTLDLSVFGLDEDYAFSVPFPGPFSVLANDLDPDGDSLVVDNPFSNVLGAHGARITLALNGDSLYDMTGANFNFLADGETFTDSVSYRVSDGNGTTDTAVASFVITGRNDTPAAALYTGNAFEDGPPVVIGNVLDVATDPDTSDILSVSGMDDSGLAGGSVVNNGDGTFLFNPGVDFQDLGVGETRDVLFDYTITDSNGGFSTQTITVTITGVNDGPTPVPDSFTTDEETPLTTGNVLINDSDIDNGSSSSVSGFDTIGTLGLVTNNGDDTFNYDPNGQFEYLAIGESATDTFDYTVSDEHGATATATVTVTVTGVNDPVSATDDSGVGFTTDEDTVVFTSDVRDNDSDPDDNDQLRVYMHAIPGTFVGNLIRTTGGVYQYNPLSGYEYLAEGESAMQTFSYGILDDNGSFDSATVTLTITGVNDAPVAFDDGGWNTNEDTVLSINAANGVLDNDTDVDTSDVLSAVPDTLVSTLGASVLLNADGSFSYDPSSATALQSLGAGSSATDTFQYTVQDGKGGSDTATAYITVAGVNDSPTAVDDTGYRTDEETPIPAFAPVSVLLNDFDRDIGDSILITSYTPISAFGATVLAHVDGTFSYDPSGSLSLNSLAEGESRMDTFLYRISDSHGATDDGYVSILVAGVNDAPAAVDDSSSTDEATTVTFSVLSNDSDDDATDVLSVSSVDTTGTVGQVTLNPDGTFTYDPNGRFEHLRQGAQTTDTFTYTISDGNGGNSTASVVVTINGLNELPGANDDAGYSTDEDTSLTVADPGVLGNDTDADGALVVQTYDATSVNGATISMNSDGSFTFDPTTSASLQALRPGRTLTDSFTYTIVDEDGATATATVTVTVDGRNEVPTANDDGPYATTEDTVLVIDAPGVLANDQDPDGALLVVEYDEQSIAGAFITVNADGSFTYDPTNSITLQLLNESEVYEDSFSYTTIDADGVRVTATVMILVRGLNEPVVPLEDGFKQLSPEDALGMINATPAAFDPVVLNELSDPNPFDPGFPDRGFAPPPYETDSPEGLHSAVQLDVDGYEEYDIVSLANHLIDRHSLLPDVYRRIETSGLEGLLVGLLSK